MRQGAARRAAAVALCALVWALCAVPAGASQAPDAGKEGAQGGVVDTGRVLELPDGFKRTGTFGQGGAALWVWPRGRRVFAVGGYAMASAGNRREGFSRIAAFDVDTLEQVASSEELPRYILNTLGAWGGLGQSHALAVDDAGGRVFAAYGNTTGQFSILNPSGHAGDLAADRQTPCFLRPSPLFGVAQAGCFGGVLVLDAVSLGVVGRVPFESLRLDGVSVAPVLRAMRYVPPVVDAGGNEELGGRVLVVVEDSPTDGTSTAGDPALRSRATVNYVAQLDPGSGRVEWVVRLDGCRGPRENPTGVGNSYPNPVGVFRRVVGGDRSVVVGCHTPGQTATVVKVPLDGAGMPFGAVRAGDPQVAAAGVSGAMGARRAPGRGDVDAVAGAAPPVIQRSGPVGAFEVVADPGGDRVLFKVVDGGAELWWVFDVGRMDWIGTIGIGPYGAGDGALNGFDEASGRLYALGKPLTSPRAFAGGLFVADTRRSPVSQALVFPEFTPPAFMQTTVGHSLRLSLAVVPPTQPGGARLVLVPEDQGRVRVWADTMPVGADPLVEPFAGRTLDLGEVDGVTGASLSAAARGYGARMLLVGGVEAAGRVGPVDPGFWYGYHGMNLVDPTPPIVVPSVGTVGHLWRSHGCSQSNREVVLAFVGPSDAAVVDGNGSRGAVQPVVVDSGTAADGEQPVTRCMPQPAAVAQGLEWEGVWRAALFGSPLVDEPSVPSSGGDEAVACVSSDAVPQGSVGDPVGGVFAGRVSCEQEETSGWAQARGVGVDGFELAQALSSFRIYRDPGRGIVSRVESVARGIVVGPVRIDGVRGVAESWANGRRFSPPEGDDAKAYVANCDFERTAGTCFTRHVFGVSTPGYSCGPCGDERALIEGLDRALGANGRARLRDPDPVLARGADNGFAAAITKPEHERLGDLVLNNDLLQTVLPTLEIIRQAPAAQAAAPGGYTNFTSPPAPVRGRQIYQFAGIEAGSSYGIACLLVYDAASNTCAAPAEPPGSITVSLADPDGGLLAGGAFEVRRDVDADGVAGLVDVVVDGGACVTADDGIGSCRLEGLAPGGYLVTQTAAPAGYGKVAEPFAVELAAGEARTVAFVNASSTSTIDLAVADEAGAPLAGAAFTAFPDPDADGKVAADAAPAASCVTAADGACRMRVPVGSYVLVQTAAPGGLEPIEPVAFTFASGGQTAQVGVVNYPLGVPAPAAGPAPVYSPPVDLQPQVSVADYTPPAGGPTDDGATVDVPQVLGGTIVRVIRAPGDTLRLLTRDPAQAAALAATLLLFALAVTAIRRRHTTETLLRT